MTTSDSATSITALQQLPGHFYYVDLNAVDVDAARTFYAQMCGWEYQQYPEAPNGYYAASIDGRDKGAITGLMPDAIAAGATSFWLPYLWVENVDATVARAAELGATIEAGPTDVFDMGRMARIIDPTGARFGIWQDAKPGDTTVKDEPGSPFWYELHTSDLDRAIAFYGDLIGWTTDPISMGPELVYHRIVPEQTDAQQTHAGAMMRLMQHDIDAGRTSTWNTYLQVADCDAAFAEAQRLGARPAMEPHDIPGAGRSSWIVDPQGAHVALMRPDPS